MSSTDQRLHEALSAARDTKALLIERGAIRQAPAVFAAHLPAAPALIVSDATEFDVAGRDVLDALRCAGHRCHEPLIFDDADLHAEHHYAETIEQKLAAGDAMPIAVGAGTVNDLVKLAADRARRPYMVVATAASMDGYTAFGASITHMGIKQTFDCPAPRAVVADLDVIAAAPPSLNAAGYADLLAKLTAGADWIIADELGVERIDPVAWRMVQEPLRQWLRDPAGIRRGDTAAVQRLIEGLMISGFAMQLTETSRPASGAEHQFSHLWDMQHHTHDGRTPSHGFKVGIATLAVAELIERLLEMPLETLNVSAAAARWPDEATEAAQIRDMFDIEVLREKALEESGAKRIDAYELRGHLELIRARWPRLRQRLRQHLPPAGELKQLLSAAGAPVEPEQIGITRDRLRHSFRLAYHIRRRYTALDLAMRAGVLDAALDEMLPGGA
jgi:glycerol-1-phosphate dehydrogenase [NAD(P)+]